MNYMFRNAELFEGNGLESWITTSLTSLHYTFRGAKLMNTNFASWDVSKVQNMGNLFFQASVFVGNGLETWQTGAVTSMWNTFNQATALNVNFGGWDVSKVNEMQRMFETATVFTGAGLEKWSVSTVTDMADTFLNANALTSCNKRKIADAWTLISSATFVDTTTYDTDWASDTCPVRCVCVCVCVWVKPVMLCFPWRA